MTYAAIEFKQGYYSDFLWHKVREDNGVSVLTLCGKMENRDRTRIVSREPGWHRCLQCFPGDAAEWDKEES